MASDIQEYCKILSEWESERAKTVTDIILRIQKLTTNQAEEDLEKILVALTNFKKEANNAKDQSKVQQQWFGLLNKSKNHVTSLIQKVKKKKGPKLIKKDSKIQCPVQLMQGKNDLYKQIMKSFYKHFVINMDEEVLKQKETIGNYLDKIIKCLFEQFGFSQEKANNSQQNTDKLFERMQKIYKELGRQSSTLAKKQMLVNKIDPQLVAKFDKRGFQSEQGLRIRNMKMQKLLKQNSTGFYEDLKKRINQDAKQQCRYCHKQTAYCEGQKQIRAADEPMTKFMRCNSCDKQWRQE